MTDFIAALNAYEAWLHDAVGRKLVAADLARKREKMRKDAHAFLRASCFWFAARMPLLAPELLRLRRVLAVGDIHVENFGLWRDAEGRLVWGVNDFDEAALLPWPWDLARLAASALLAKGAGLDAAQVMAALLAGYREGLAAPRPRVLAEADAWLRDAFLADDSRRAEFWDEIAALWPVPKDAAKPKRADLAVLHAALPNGATQARFAPRQAGLGSLGRPRFVAFATFQGGPVLREAKAMAPSCFTRDLAGAAFGAPGQAAIHLAAGPARAPDPWFRLHGGMLVRRLGPDSRKLEGSDLQGALGTQLLQAMGLELGSLHAATPGAARRIPREADATVPGRLAGLAAALAAETRTTWQRNRDALRRQG